jgi:hypothetical protein
MSIVYEKLYARFLYLVRPTHTKRIDAHVVFVAYFGFLLIARKRLVTCTVSHRSVIPAVKCMDRSESISANAHLVAEHVMQLVKYSYVPV